MIAAGTPVVTLPGRFMRGRQTAAMLRLAGVPELVAESASDWVARAAAAAHPEANREWRRRIALGRDALFGRREPLAALEEALLALAAGAPPPVL